MLKQRKNTNRHELHTNKHEFIRVNSCEPLTSKVKWRICVNSCLIRLLIITTFLFCPQTTLAFEWEAQPTPHMPSASPFSYLPAPIRMPPSRPDRMDHPIPNIAPQAPAIITDAQGNKAIFHNGKLRARIDRNGKITYYAQGQKRFQRDSLNNLKLTREFKYNGSEMTTHNEHGNILGYERYDLGGKLLKTYDAHHHSTSHYKYDQMGYWQVNEITNVWKRYELDTPIKERRGGKYGALVAYWKKDGDELWRIEKTTDSSGRQIDGNRTRFDRFAREYYETYANDGTLIAKYEWENHRLAYEIDQSNHYKKYNLYGVSEEGFINPDSGTGHVEWVHTWNDTRHIKAHNVFTNHVRYYEADINDEKIDKITWIITQEDIDRDLGRDMEDPNKIGLTQSDLDKELLLQDFIYFWEVKDMSIEQIEDFFNIKTEDAGRLYDLIQELVNKDKAAAGLTFIADFAFTTNPQDGRTSYILKLTAFDENNNSYTVIYPNQDPTYSGYNRYPYSRP